MTEPNPEEIIELQETALKELKAWLSSENFRESADYDTIIKSTSMGHTKRKLAEEGRSWWSGEEGEKLVQLINDIVETWIKRNWLRVEKKVLGRPRKAEYSREVLNKAWRLYNYGRPQGYRTDGSYKWAESVLGESIRKTSTKFFVVFETVNRELLERLGADKVEGLSRTELAQKLELSKSYTNRLVRWLLNSGEWKEVRTRDGKRRDRVLRRI